MGSLLILTPHLVLTTSSFLYADPSIRTSQRSGSAAEDGLLDPLILAVSVSDSALSNKDSESDDERSDEPASSIGEAYRLLTAPVKV